MTGYVILYRWHMTYVIIKSYQYGCPKIPLDLTNRDTYLRQDTLLSSYNLFIVYLVVYRISFVKHISVILSKAEHNAIHFWALAHKYLKILKYMKFLCWEVSQLASSKKQNDIQLLTGTFIRPQKSKLQQNYLYDNFQCEFN